MRRICINALSVNPAMTGIGQYAKSMLDALAGAKAHSDHGFTILGSAGHDMLRNGYPREWRLEVVKGAGLLWEQTALPTMLEQDEVDIYHSPLFTVPIVKVCAYVMTLHDVIPLTHPELVPEAFRALFSRSVEPSLRASDVVITTSEAAKADIATHLDVAPERVRVVRQCVSGEFRPRPREEIEPVIARYGLKPGGYVLYAGAVDPRKNVEGLLAAYALGQVFKDFGLALAVSGRTADGEYTLGTATAKAGVTEGIVDLGYVPNTDLPCVMAGARAFVFPSFAEGFGRPVLEAMASGLPVVASDIPPHREVAGDAAEYADPSDAGDLAATIRHVLSEGEAERAARCEMGLARAREFTPQRFAEGVLAVYRELGEDKRGDGCEDARENSH